MNPLLICLILRYHRDLKPSSSPCLEEDEGFSDWTQRRERRRQQRLQELHQGGEEDGNDDEVTKTGQASISSLQRKEYKEVATRKQDVEWKQGQEEDKVQDERVRSEEEKTKELDSEVGGPQRINVMCSTFILLQRSPSHPVQELSSN